MIQELLAGAGLIGGEKKISITSGVVETSVLSPNSLPSSASASPSPSSSTAATPTSSSTSESQKLRCPRCDSSNTKFCYYNNYNLTQPRHFCKTCRRYWTKGGALRNVPIGGGCRKNKNHPRLATPAAGRSSTGRYRAVSPDIGKSASLVTGFCQEPRTDPASWAFPQNSHFLSLLRATSNPNPSPSPCPNPMSNISAAVKEEAGVTINGSIMSIKAVGLDPHSSQVGSNIGACSSFLMGNNRQETHHQHQHNDLQRNGFFLGEALQSTPCTRELYQRLRSSAIYHPDHSSCLSINATSSSSSSPPIINSAPLAGGELGYWNLTHPWSDIPTTTNGAYP